MMTNDEQDARDNETESIKREKFRKEEEAEKRRETAIAAEDTTAFIQKRMDKMEAHFRSLRDIRADLNIKLKTLTRQSEEAAGIRDAIEQLAKATSALDDASESLSEVL